MKTMLQQMCFCDTCKRGTMHQGNDTRINWVMHIVLLFFVIGFITLPLAILNKLGNTRVGGKTGMFCSVCGTEAKG